MIWWLIRVATSSLRTPLKCSLYHRPLRRFCPSLRWKNLSTFLQDCYRRLINLQEVILLRWRCTCDGMRMIVLRRLLFCCQMRRQQRDESLWLFWYSQGESTTSRLPSSRGFLLNLRNAQGLAFRKNSRLSSREEQCFLSTCEQSRSEEAESTCWCRLSTSHKYWCFLFELLQPPATEKEAHWAKPLFFLTSEAEEERFSQRYQLRGSQELFQLTAAFLRTWIVSSWCRMWLLPQ